MARAGERGSLGGVLLVLVGVVLLLANLGYLTEEFWEAVRRFWPLLLVVTGLDLLTRGSRWRWVGPTLAVLLLAAALMLVFWSPADHRFTWRLPRPARIEVTLTTVAGKVALIGTKPRPGEVAS